jgi:hypothetical protein
MAVSGTYVYVVWAQTTSTNKISQIYFAASANGGMTFSTAMVVDASTTTAALTPVIAANGNYVYVAWNSGAASYVTVSANNGGTWTSPHKYSSAHEPQIAGVGANVYAIADGVNIAVSNNAGMSWTTFNEGHGAEPWIAASGTDVLAAWETKSSSSVIYAVVSTNSGVSFSTKKILSSTTPDAWAPMLGISGSTFFVAWRTFPGGSNSQEYVDVSTTAGSSWSAPDAIGIANRDNQWPFTVATSGNNIYIMWSEKANTKNSDWQTLVTYSSDGGSTWSTPVSPSNNGPLSGAQPEQDIATGAISANGATAYGAWENNGTTTQIFFSSS